jgi:hypothetical protein
MGRITWACGVRSCATQKRLGRAAGGVVLGVPGVQIGLAAVREEAPAHEPGATFTGNAVFRGATFAGDVNLFRGAHFAYEPDFKNSTQRGLPFVPPQLQPAQKSWTSEGDDSAS